MIADEPVSALDVSIQAQVINLMQDLQEEFGLSYIFISHDLSVVRHISDRIFVMYLGHIVETGRRTRSTADRCIRTRAAALRRAETGPRRRRRGGPKRRRIPSVPERIGPDDLPSPLNKPSGCAFRTRCPIARPSCADALPPLELRGAGWSRVPFRSSRVAGIGPPRPTATLCDPIRGFA